MSEKIFCGSGKEFGQYGSVGLNVCLSDLPKEFIKEYEGKKYIKLNLHKMKTPKEKQSHYLEVNTWKPEQKQSTSGSLSSMPPAEEDHLPF